MTITLPEPTPPPTAQEVALDLTHALAAAHATLDANKDNRALVDVRRLVAYRFVTSFRAGTTLDQIAEALLARPWIAPDIAPLFTEARDLRPFFAGEVADVQ